METASMQNANAAANQRFVLDKPSRLLITCGMGLMTLGLAGCGLGGSSHSSVSTVTIGSATHTITGMVHGGQQPISNATLQLYAVGTSGLKSAAQALITKTVTTSDGTGIGGNSGNANNTMAAGGFTITGDYSCTGATQVYLVATGGNSSAAPDGAPTNSAIALMAPLGSCATLLANAATTSLQINEVTTVAAVYALAPYMSGYANVGTTGGTTVAQQGMVNAVSNFNNLINLAGGSVGGATLPSDAVVPVNELNTLGNVIAACVNTSSSTSSPCQSLATATGATDTIGMTLAFANNPSSSALTALWSLGAGVGAPFQPALGVQPNDWTVAIKYPVSGNLKTPYGLAVDSTGNVWIANASATATPVVKLSPTGGLLGAYTGAATGLVGPRGIACDKAGNVWLASPFQNSVVELTSAGALKGTYTVGGLNGPVALALDSGGNAWVANLVGNSVTELSATGSAVQTSLTAGGTISGPTGIALDSTGNVYVANSGGGNVIKLVNSTGAAAAGSPFSDSALQGTTSVAVDAVGNVWATGSTTGTAVAGAVSSFASSGAAASYSPLGGGGLGLSTGSAASGTKLWVTNGLTAGSLSQLVYGQGTPSSPSVGFGSLNAPVGVAVDLSGDVWTANSGDNTVTQFIGLATPVTTPLVANVGP
jgi:streptogramin lyase